MANQSRYRVVNWLGGRILESRELMALQAILEGVNASDAQVVYDLNGTFLTGATQNISLSISGRTVTFSQTNGSYPMMIFVRGRWEVMASGDLPPITLTTSQGTVYLNYSLDLVTYNGAGGTLTDATLVDTTTSQPTAEMGQIDFTIGVSDTSGVSLNSALQLEKNTTPIILWEFTTGSSPYPMQQTHLANVNPTCLAGEYAAGPVYLTTNTSAGVAVSTDDTRMSNPRTPVTGSVIDASLASPVLGSGTNARDGSNKYTSVSSGGLSADNIIYLEATERLSDYLAFLYNQILAAVAGGVITFNSRSGTVLPQSGDYTAAMVGAAPSSHVGTSLVAATATGTILSHLASVTVPSSGSGGYALNQPSGVLSGPLSFGGGTPTAAYGIFQSGTLQAGVTNTGDFWTTALNTLVAAPGGSPLNFTGALTGILAMGQILIDHINQTSGSTNPHGTSGNNSNGYWTYANGKYDMWAKEVSITTQDQFISFPHSFTTLGSIALTVICDYPSGDSPWATKLQGSTTLSGFTVHMNDVNPPSGGTIDWIAVGL